jgi:hypothetical protein
MILRRHKLRPTLKAPDQVKGLSTRLGWDDLNDLEEPLILPAVGGVNNKLTQVKPMLGHAAAPVAP